jgi:hypothetical protein
MTTNLSDSQKKEISTSTLSCILDYLHELYQASKLNAEVAHSIQQEAEALWTSFQKDPKISQDTKKAIIGKSSPAVIAFVTKEPAAAVETPAEEAAADTAEEEETAFGISDIIQSIVGILFN